MAGRPRTSPVHRPKPEICSDIAFVLGAGRSHLSLGAVYAVLDQALNLWSAHDGKYEGCPFWTAAALLARNDHARYNGSGLKIPPQDTIIHEHIVPKNVVRDVLLALKPSPTVSDVAKLLDEYCVAAIITRPEDNTLAAMGLKNLMPQGWQPGHDKWARYRQVPLTVLDVSNNNAQVCP